MVVVEVGGGCGGASNSRSRVRNKDDRWWGVFFWGGWHLGLGVMLRKGKGEGFCSFG